MADTGNLVPEKQTNDAIEASSDAVSKEGPDAGLARQAHEAQLLKQATEELNARQRLLRDQVQTIRNQAEAIRGEIRILDGDLGIRSLYWMGERKDRFQNKWDTEAHDTIQGWAHTLDAIADSIEQYASSLKVNIVSSTAVINQP